MSDDRDRAYEDGYSESSFSPPRGIMDLGEMSQMSMIPAPLTIRRVPPLPPLENRTGQSCPRIEITTINSYSSDEGENRENESSQRRTNRTPRSHPSPFTAQRSPRSPFAALPADDPRRGAEHRPEESFFTRSHGPFSFTPLHPPWFAGTNTNTMDAQRTTELEPAPGENTCKFPCPTPWIC